MNLDRPQIVRGLIAATAIVFVVALIGAFTVDNGGKTKLATDNSATSTTAALETTTTAAPSVTTARGTATTAAKKATATTAASAGGPPPTVSANVPDPGPVKPPAAGKYDYAVTQNGQSSTMTETITAKPDENGAARRTDTYTDGQGNTFTNEQAWSADGMRWLSSHIASAQGTFDCTWTPPILFYAFPLSVGKTWNIDSTCKTTVQNTPITVHVTGNAKVTGKSLDKVAGTNVATWVIEATQNTDVQTTFGTQHTTATLLGHFAPSRGLDTYEKESGSAYGQTYNSERTLQNLTPK